VQCAVYSGQYTYECTVIQLNIQLSRGSAATCLRRGGKFCSSFQQGSSRNTPVKELLRLVNICQSNTEYKSGTFLWLTVYMHHRHIAELNPHGSSVTGQRSLRSQIAVFGSVGWVSGWQFTQVSADRPQSLSKLRVCCIRLSTFLTAVAVQTQQQQRVAVGPGNAHFISIHAAARHVRALSYARHRRCCCFCRRRCWRCRQFDN